MPTKRAQRATAAGGASPPARSPGASPTVGAALPPPITLGGVQLEGCVGTTRVRSISMSSPSDPVGVAILSKNQLFRVDFGGKNDAFRLSDLYLNDLSDIRVFELMNLKNRRLRVQLRAELRKPFHTSVCNFQLENENLSRTEVSIIPRKEINAGAAEDYSHVPTSVVRASTMAALSADNAYLGEGYNELFNHISTVQEIELDVNETKRVIFSMCTKLATDGSVNPSTSNSADSSEDERMHLNETSCLGLTGRLILKARFDGPPPMQPDGRISMAPLGPLPDVQVPLQARVCRSLLRLDVKELHFDDCIPGGSFVKDFTVWNRSEIPLLFQLVSSVSAFDETKNMLTFTDYNSGYKINEKTVQAAAYGHVRIRVTYRPSQTGERFFEVHAQNLHDARNVKILKIHAVTNKEHHREGLSIKEPNGSYMMSGSKLDYGDCYTGIATAKTLLLKNATEATLHVELTSDRPKEVSFELKLLPNRARSSRVAREDDILSPTDSNDGSSRKGSVSPDAAAKAAAAFASFDTTNSYGADSDDDGEENEGEYFEDDFPLGRKRLSFDDNALGDPDDGDDDFEFDREPRPTPASPPLSPKMRSVSRQTEPRRRLTRKKARRSTRALARVRNGSYESGVDSGSIPSSPERRSRGDTRQRNSMAIDDSGASNFLVETLDLPPGVERTILVWYCPQSSSDTAPNYDDGVDPKASRLSRQTFRVSFRCFQVQGSWQQAQSRVYDRTLGKSIHIRARTCSSIVTVSPSILHLGDCNIGELKSSACVLTNHSELPTVIKPIVTSKVISTVPNDEVTLGPKQSIELKVEIIPRKVNPNYTRLISVVNLKNKANISQVCVRSSNMDAHHVIYHSLFYKLLTPSRAAFLNFDHVAMNSLGIQVFDLENITNAPLQLSLQTSDSIRVRLFSYRQLAIVDEVTPLVSASSSAKFSRDEKRYTRGDPNSQSQQLLSSSMLNSLPTGPRLVNASGGITTVNTSASGTLRQKPVIRRRRSFGCEADLKSPILARPGAKNKSSVLRGYLSKKLAFSSSASPPGWGGASTPPESQTKLPTKVEGERTGSGSATPPISVGLPSADAFGLERLRGGALSSSALLDTQGVTGDTDRATAELQALLDLFDRSRSEIDAFLHSTVPLVEKEEEIVTMVKSRVRRFNALVAEKKLLQIAGPKERNLRIPAKSRQRVIAVFTPLSELPPSEATKLRIEKYKVFITLPPGGNKKAVADASRFDPSKAMWTTSKHPFDSRPSVRELLVKSRVCRSVMNVNQKNINFGRITVSTRSSKKLIVQNMSAIPLVYAVEKTGFISSAFLEIKEGEVGVVKGFGTREISFEFQPTLAGPFEEKLKIVNVQDPENSLFVTIKAKVVKRETFKLLQSGQVLSLGKCLAGERSEVVKIAVRNTSRKKREYAIQADPAFSNSHLRPTFYFSIDDTPSATITQAQEKKLDEDLEKLEHKLRIAVTKKKNEKIAKLNFKISRVKALLSGEQLPDDAAGGGDESTTRGAALERVINDVYDSNSESEFSETESVRSVVARRQLVKQSSMTEKSVPGQVMSVSSSQQTVPNMLTFTLEAEAVGRIEAYAIFQPVKTGQSPASDNLDSSVPTTTAPRSQKARKRQLKRDLAPLSGVGKLVLFEQQNKDVMKELQYNADVYLRTPASEAAYYRAVGKAPLPPVLHAPLGKRPSARVGSSGSRAEEECMPPMMDVTAPAKALADSVDANDQLEYPSSPTSASKEDTGMTTYAGLSVKLEPTGSQLGMIRRSTLLVPIEESPSDTMGWTITFSTRNHTKPFLGEVRWRPSETCRNLLSLVATRRSNDPGVVDNVNSRPSTTEELPFKLEVSPEEDITIRFRWVYTSGSGFGSSTAMSSCVSSSTVDLLSKTAQVTAGRLEIADVEKRTEESSGRILKSIDVALVKAVKRSLYVDVAVIDLGQHQQNTPVHGCFVLRNRSRHAVKFLLLTPSLSREAPTGSIAFESSTGKVDAMSSTTIEFTFKGMTPGQQTEQILVRNLSDRLDTLVVNITARVTRPVYVRVPELDPHSTGTLEVLDLGPCYVTPEMQDTSLDSPNVMLKFSKVHKLSLVNQVAETLIICASTNLKTQCYVYEDIRLQREANHVVLGGKNSVDLFVAVRPRLPSDALKSGSYRELVGGIRVQLFRASDQAPTSSIVPPSDSDEKASGPPSSPMVAEFTIKFIGVAGVSLARIVPQALEFEMETSPSPQQAMSRCGKFEIVNVSKALPLVYRLFVANDPDNYCDDDQALKVELDTVKGDVMPGGTCEIHFTMSASVNGLFRRKILVENVQYPGKVMILDLTLFINNRALTSQVLTLASGSDPADKPRWTTTLEQQVDFGTVPVVQLEGELAELCAVATQRTGTSESDSSPHQRQFRIFSERTSIISNCAVPSLYGVLLTNTQGTDLVVRPISTLPLCFQWCEDGEEARVSSWFHIQPNAYSAPSSIVRYLQHQPDDEGTGVKSAVVFYGGIYRIPARTSRRLLFRFAPISGTGGLPIDAFSSGRGVPLKGFISIQSFSGGSVLESSNVAKTLNVLSATGMYAESQVVIVEKKVSLGKIGYSLGWQSSSFSITIKNCSELVAYVIVRSSSDAIVVKGAHGASETKLISSSADQFPSLTSLAAAASNQDAVWRIEPLEMCTVTLDFVQHSALLVAGHHEFPITVFNLLNPRNVDRMVASAQIVSSYAEVTVDPESSGGMIGSSTDSMDIAFLPSVTIPPTADGSANPHRPSFWFSVKNVFDEELSVRVSSDVAESFKRIAELVICSRSSNTLLSTVNVAPGDTVDIRVICRVYPSARITPGLLGALNRQNDGDWLTFGSVGLDITVQNMKDATQKKHIAIRGKVTPGKTFTLSSSSLHFHAVATDIPDDMPTDFLPASIKMKMLSVKRDVAAIAAAGAPATVSHEPGKASLYQLRNPTETFWIRNPSTSQALNFVIESLPMYTQGLCLVKGSVASEMQAMSEYIQAVPVPSSGTIQPGEGMKITVRLEESSLAEGSGIGGGDSLVGAAAKTASLLHKMRHHPSWRSNSWGSELLDTTNDPTGPSHMTLQIRDVDMTSDSALASEVDVHIMLQSTPPLVLPGPDGVKSQTLMDRSLLGAAFAAREKRLTTSAKPSGPTSPAVKPAASRIPPTIRETGWTESSVLDHFEEFDVRSIKSGAVAGRRSQLPVLSIRGCTPADNSALDSTRYVIDVGQHTVRNGGEVEWEITVERVQPGTDGDGEDLQPVEYRLYLVDPSARTWFQLSRDRGTLDQGRSYQSIVLYFLRDTIGVYSTFFVLQNMTNPGDLKVIQVKLEVIADLNALRSMTSGIDPGTNLFRVLVSNQSTLRKPRRASMEDVGAAYPPDSKLIVDYGEVYYHQLYHNHSIVIENASSMRLDFTLSSNAPAEVGFSISPTSFNEVSTVTLSSRGRAQVFLHFRPRKPTEYIDTTGHPNGQWNREVEVYVNCRLVKDFRETVVLRAICCSPQLAVDVTSMVPAVTSSVSTQNASHSISQASFLGMVFAMPESALTRHPTETTERSSISGSNSQDDTRYVVVRNTRSDVRARVALRNDSLFFSVTVDSEFNSSVKVDHLEKGICAGRRSTLVVTIPPQSCAIFRIAPDLDSLQRHRQVWDHSVKEHITLYNIKQFAEHYQVTLCFTCSNVTSYYIPPHIIESYPFSALEDTIAKFLQNYNATWRWLISYHSRHSDREASAKVSSSALSIPRLTEVLSELETALELSSPLSPRGPGTVAGFNSEEVPSEQTEDRETLRQLLHSYRALYFDFFYITDELIWYGVRSNAVRHSLMLADLAYAVVFNHEIFRAFLAQTHDAVVFPRLLLPWSRQLRHFLSFFPENQEATRPLRELYDQLQKFELDM